MRLTFRKKALLLILPILGIVSAVYTYDAIKTEKEIVRTEIIKRAEAITTLATRTGELPVLSSNPELLKGVVSSLRANSEISSVAFFDTKMNPLIQEGVPISGRLPALSPDRPITMFDEGNFFVFYAPVFTVRAGDDIDIFHGGIQSREARENIGWVRLGFSKAAMNETTRKVVLRGFLLAVVFTVGSSIAVFILITIATRPLMTLSHAARKLEKGEYPEIREISTSDEIGELGAAFNRMSVAIKERESRLVDSENRIRELFERVEHAIFRLDTKGVVVEANSKFRDLFEDAEKFSDILYGEERVAACFQKAVSRNGVHQEENARGKGDAERIVLLSLYPETDQKGSLKGFDGYIIDITEKKGLEERLLRSQKLTAVGTLAGGIAHDFNNLLQAILGYSEMLLDMSKEGDTFRNPVKIIHNAAKRGAELTKTILSVTRKEKMEIRNVDINEVVKGAVELLGRSIPKSIEIVVDLGKDMPAIMADPSHLQQVILNLTVNARDAMPDGGRLTIETAVVGKEYGAAVSGRTEDERFVKLSISDAGIGMDKATQTRIFEPFFTTKEAGKGTGLGLYMVYSIVENHGGYINVYSEPGMGTRFNVYLPVKQGEVTETPSGSLQIAGSETVLVIDDDASVRDIYKDMLTPLGYTVIAAEGGAAGIKTFREKQNEVSLVILDMVMPVMSGNEAFRLLKSIRADVNILLCSGYIRDGHEGVENLVKDGAAGFLQKPFSRDDIGVAIRAALSKSDATG
ncbi:MAG: ATP-binding protein [Nitrospiraceae bacterium]|nr:ATP-binding protein [Nitrospiraceae bacterium]